MVFHSILVAIAVALFMLGVNQMITFCIKKDMKHITITIGMIGVGYILLTCCSNWLQKI